MKKFILTILISLLSIFAFSQETIIGRANLFYTGYDDGTEMVWNEYPTKCDILVQIDFKKITVYSPTPQVYTKISIDVHEEKMSRWLASNQDGMICYVYVGQYGKSNEIGLTIEFSDVAWTYVVTPEN